MLIELHIIQNFAPSCLNRDDLNAPKECEFGGVRRARISSQSLKRAARWHADFEKALADGIGTRTKFLRTELVKYLVTRGKDESEALKVAEPVASSIGSGVTDGRTAIALYLGHDEIARIGAAVEARYDDLLAAAGTDPEADAPTEEKAGKGAKPAKKAKKGSGSSEAKGIADAISKAFTPGTKAADIALFGRMIAEATNFNVDAAAQVAHALSTHAVAAEFDFFTAVDDLQPKGDPGAGMMGTQQFNSATFYRYANVHLPQLATNLGGDLELARAATLAFASAFVRAIPGAKQNSHAAFNPPDLVFVVVREQGQPLSLANAFAKPVSSQKQNGIVGESGAALQRYWDRLTTAYGSEGIAAAAYFKVAAELDGVALTGAVDAKGLTPLLGVVRDAIAAWQPEAKK